ncbi:ankyrin repeat-containing domain protein [Chlamydoabsidia padenii]|nr:ankyrin repeat-containing domain protein [Chlamydoabsidia padenii]
MISHYNGKKDDTKNYHLQLHLAATNGNVGLVKFALDHGASMDSVVNGFMPLQLACVSDNNLAVVQYLIDRGAQVNAQRWSKKHSTDKSQAVTGAIGSTALHVACANGCTKVVELLLRNNAHVDLKDKYGSTPRDISIVKHHMDIVMLLDTSVNQQERQSIDTTNSHYSLMDEQTRRQSLPSVLRDKTHSSLGSTITDMPCHPIDSLSSYMTQPIDIKQDQGKRLPELCLSISSSTIDYTPLPSPTSPASHNKKIDWYSYGVLHHDGSESYLASLERRAYGWNYLPSRHPYYDQQETSSLCIDNIRDQSAIFPPTNNDSSLTINISSPPLETKTQVFGGRKSMESTRQDILYLKKRIKDKNYIHNRPACPQRRSGFFSRWFASWCRK